MEICSLNLDLIVICLFKRQLSPTKKRPVLPKKHRHLFKSLLRDQHHHLKFLGGPSQRINFSLINSLLLPNNSNNFGIYDCYYVQYNLQTHLHNICSNIYTEMHTHKLMIFSCSSIVFPFGISFRSRSAGSKGIYT